MLQASIASDEPNFDHATPRRHGILTGFLFALAAEQERWS
jgi:hypothetical protein